VGSRKLLQTNDQVVRDVTQGKGGQRSRPPGSTAVLPFCRGCGGNGRWGDALEPQL
jgi:hypothetical protein